MSTPQIIDADPWNLIGQEVTLSGIARDAVEGAVILLSDGTPVYVKGLFSWDDALDRKRLLVTGTLRMSGSSDQPLVDAQGNHRQGSEGDRLVIENATWKPAD
ncbi:MAG TPA: hypothetical protein VM261_02285 [Kofleriaceae bacterium]|nr:hypothetical protein [Kofleriaceae bacterium]